MFSKILRILPLGKKCSLQNYKQKYLREEDNFTEETHHETNKTAFQNKDAKRQWKNKFTHLSLEAH